MKNNRKTKTNKAVILLFSVLAACMPFLHIESPAGDPTKYVLVNMLASLNSSLAGSSLISTVLACALYKLGTRRYDRDMPGRAAFMVYSLLLAFIWLTAESFRIDNTLRYLNADAGQILKSVIYVLGAAYLIFEILAAFCHLVMKENYASALSGRIPEEIRKRPFLSVFAGILLLWALPLVNCYPSFMCNDSWTQFLQYWGYIDFTSHHPPVHTLLVGLFTHAGRALGSTNAGLFGFVLFQAVVFAAVLAYTYQLMVRLRSPVWLKVFFLLSAAFAPHYLAYVCVILKDSLYSIMLLLFVDELICALNDIKGFLSQKRHRILSVLSIMGVLLFRNNGKHILYPTLLLAAFLVLKKRQELGKAVVIRALVLILASVTFAGILEKAVIRTYDIQPGSIAEALSLPFQQTARTVAEHGEEITQEEREAIDAVLEYDSLAAKYTPHISDPVKATARADADKEALGRYLATWFKMFFKYPFTYVKATLNQNYLLVYPLEENVAVYANLLNFEGGRKELMATVLQETGITDVRLFPMLRALIHRLQCLLYSLPVTGILLHHASYVIILLASMILALQKKAYTYLTAALPGFMSVIVIILAPVIRRHPRYAFPIVYTLPILIAYYIYCMNKNRNNDRKSHRN